MNSLPQSSGNNQLSNTLGGEIAAPIVKKKGPCCVCPDTKKARDMCILDKGENDCLSFIEAHKVCLRKEGFDA